MGKYAALAEHLKRQSASAVTMRFSEIERLIGAPLPPSARRHRPWWSNNPSNSVITRAWLDAGYRTEQVDMGGERLVFRRTARNPPPKLSGEEWLKRTYGAHRGTVTFAADFDPGEKMGRELGELWEAPDYKGWSE